MERGDYGIFFSGRTEIHVGALPSAKIPLVSRREDVEYGPSEEGGVVTDGLYHGY